MLFRGCQSTVSAHTHRRWQAVFLGLLSNRLGLQSEQKTGRPTGTRRVCCRALDVCGQPNVFWRTRAAHQVPYEENCRDVCTLHSRRGCGGGKRTISKLFNCSEVPIVGFFISLFLPIFQTNVLHGGRDAGIMRRFNSVPQRRPNDPPFTASLLGLSRL